MTPWPALDDPALASAVVATRPEALQEAYRRHALAVWGTARRVLGDSTAAEDVVQEVFWRLWSRPRAYDPTRGTLRGWLLGQAHSRAVDVLRSDVARKRREERDARRRPDTVHPGVEPLVVEEALAHRVRVAVGELPSGERQAVTLAYYGGHSYRQVATLLAEPEGTVKGRIRAGLRRVQLRLIDDGTAAAWAGA